MKDELLTVQFNNKIAGGVYHMSLAGNCSEIKRPGQFIDILIEGFYLRRPISIFDHDDDHVEILYRVAGNGTDALSAKVPGDVLDVLLPLGNGFDAERRGGRNLLVAGGIGMPPIHELAGQLMRAGSSSRGPSSGERADFRVLLGFRSGEDAFGIDALRSLGIEPVIATEDGSLGIRGLVTDVMDMMKSAPADRPDAAYDYDYVFCCGPEPMLKAVYARSADGQFSFEERMGCGFGACMGCSCETRYGYKRICRDGPVLQYDEIIWRDQDV